MQMKKLLTLCWIILMGSISWATDVAEVIENFNTPRFHNNEIHLFTPSSNKTLFATSLNTGYEWGAYSPTSSNQWGPIGYLYSDNLSSSRNSMGFINDTESEGSYVYCQFGNDRLKGLSKVSIRILDQGEDDLLNLIIRDANNEWYYASSANGIYASQSEITFSVNNFTWMKVSATVSNNLNNHNDIADGLGDIREGAVNGSPDLSFITGGGIILLEGATSNLGLRIGSIKWEGKKDDESPTAVAPKLGSTLHLLKTNLEWTTLSSKSLVYDVWFSKQGTNLVKVANDIQATEWEIDALDDLSTYNWRVDAKDTDGNVFEGTLWTFKTKKGQSPYFSDLQQKRIVSSQDLKWTQFGPGMSGYCEEFWCHPTDPNVMLMSPDMYNSYGSWDNGHSWQTIKDVDGTGKDMRRIQAIVFSHQDADFGYALDVRGHLYQSVDRGRTWSRKNFNGNGRFSELAVDPSDDNNWYAGAGDFWNIKSNHRSKNNTLGHTYQYSAYGHIFKSTDKGKTWKKITNGLPSTLDVGKIIVDPRNSNHIIMVANSGVYRSTNKGESWSLSGTGLPNNNPRDMAYYYNENNNEFILYALEQTHYIANGNTVTSKGGVFKSLDGGVTWSSITGNLAIDMTKITNYTSTDKYYRAIAQWFGISKDAAKSAYPNRPTTVLPVYNRIKVNPSNKNEIYLGHNVKHDYSFGPGDVWKTSDGGQNWIATARTGVYWSENKNGDYWADRNNPRGVNTNFAHLQAQMDIESEYFGNRFLEVNARGDVFICLDQQVLRSTDNGHSWQQIDDYETKAGSKHWVGRGGSNLPGRFMLLETGIKDRYLFCSGEHGLWESASLGDFDNQEAIAVKQIEGQVNPHGAHSIASVAVHPDDPNTIYILMFRQSHRGYFRKSTDGGKTWTNVSKPIKHEGNDSSDMMFQYSLTIDYDNPNNIYFCLIDNAISEVSANRFPSDFKDTGVYKSQDGGKTWRMENNGFPTGASVRRIKMDPDNSSILYATLNEGKNNVRGGLYKTTDRGNNWSKMNIPSEIKSVNNVFIDRNTKYIFISCGRSKGTFAEGGVWRSKDNGASWEKIFYMPYIWQTETSPVNPDIITVSVALPNEFQGATTFNPGAYLSTDGGETWQKINYNLGQPDEITDLKPDPYVEGAYWCALKGSGWAKAGIPVTLGEGKTDDDDDDDVINAIEENSKATIQLYPNPIENICHIGMDFQNTSNTQIDIFDLNAQKVLTIKKTISAGVKKVTFDTSILAKGVYILSISTDQEQYFKKFIKK